MKVYLIDSSNNNKVIGEFQSKKDATTYLSNKFDTINTNETKEEFFDNFFFVPAQQLENKAYKLGKRIYQYYT